MGAIKNALVESAYQGTAAGLNDNIKLTPYQQNAFQCGYTPRSLFVDEARENVPVKLLEYKQWIVWQYQPNDEKPKKMPLKKSGQSWVKGSSTDESTYMSFEDALQAYENNSELDGIGFAITKNDPFVFADFDNCFQDGALNEWSSKISTTLDSYTELSVSGSGIHTIVDADVLAVEQWHCKTKKFHKGDFEIYRDGRFMTFTGSKFGTRSDIEERTSQVRKLQKDIETAKEAKTPPNGSEAPQSVNPESTLNTLSEVLEVARDQASRADSRAAEFLHFYYKGFISEDESGDDLKLMNQAAFYTAKNPELMREIYLTSALGQREKAKRKDYQDRTIKKAIADKTTVYTRDYIDPAELEKINAMLNEPDMEAAKKSLVTLADFPAELVNMPHGLGLIQDYVYNRMIYPSRSIAGFTALAALTCFVQKRFTIQSYSGLGFNEYYMVMAGTGFGKEDLRNAISKLNDQLHMRLLDSRRVVADEMSTQQWSAPATMQGMHTQLEDNNAQFYLSDEFGEWLQSTSANSQRQETLGYFMQSYSKALGTIAPPNTAGKSYTPVRYPRVSILATSTAERMLETMTLSHADSGAYNRWVFMVAELEPIKKRYEGMIYEPGVEVLDLLEWLHEQEETPLKFTPEAWELFMQIDTEKAEPLKHEHGRLAGRLSEQAIKMAGLIALSDKRLEISADDLQKAYNIRLGLHDRLQTIIEYSGAMSGKHHTTVALEQVETILRKREFVRVSELKRDSRPFKALSIYEQNSVIDTLIKFGALEPVQGTKALMKSKLYKE